MTDPNHDLYLLLAGALNALITWGALKLMARKDELVEQYPYVIPAAAPFIGLAVGVIQSQLARRGLPALDFGPILGLFGGGTGMAIGQVIVQSERARAARRVARITPGGQVALSRDGRPV